MHASHYELDGDTVDTLPNAEEPEEALSQESSDKRKRHAKQKMFVERVDALID